MLGGKLVPQALLFWWALATSMYYVLSLFLFVRNIKLVHTQLHFLDSLYFFLVVIQCVNK